MLQTKPIKRFQKNFQSFKCFKRTLKKEFINNKPAAQAAGQTLPKATQ